MTSLHKECLKNMNKKLNSILLSAFASFVSLTAQAQADDFGMDFSLAAEKKLCRRVGVTLEGNARTQDNTGKMDRWSVGATIDAKVYNATMFDVKVFAGWEYMWIYNLREVKDKYETEDIYTPDGMETVTYYEGYNDQLPFWRDRHRTSAGISASYKPNKRWSFQLKETFQYSHFAKAETTKNKYRLDDDGNLYFKESETEFKKAKDKTVLRSRLTAQYNVKGLPLNPYASAEYACGLSYATNKWKFTAGADYKINKLNILTVFYRYQTEDDDDDPNGHIIGIGYKVKL